MKTITMSLAIVLLTSAMCLSCSVISPLETRQAEERMLDKNNKALEAAYYRDVYEAYSTAVEYHPTATGDGFDQYVCHELDIQSPYDAETDLPISPGPKMITMYERARKLYRCDS